MKAICSAIVLTSMLACPAYSQVQRSGNADARVAQQLQQLSTERAALQAENARLKQELEQIKAQLQKSETTAKTLQARTRTLEQTAGRGNVEAQQAEEQLERTRGQLQELIGKFRETVQTLRDVEIDRDGATGRLAARERELKTCVDRNAGLYNLNAEVLDRMEGRGFWSGLAEREPFTRLKRVELENMIDDYRYRADELRLEQQKQAKQ